MPTGSIPETSKVGTPLYSIHFRWHQWCPHYRGSTVVSYPVRVCLPVRKSLVNKVEFLSWAYSPKVVRTNRSVCEIGNYYLALPVTKVYAIPRNSTWFTRPFLLVRGWGSGDETRNVSPHERVGSGEETRNISPRERVGVWG